MLAVKELGPVPDLVLYDGVCGLCNRSVGVILRRDQAKRFRFASIQSELGRRILARHGHGEDVLDSLIVIVDDGERSGRLLRKSDAVLYIASRVGGLWRLSRVFRILPVSVLDRLYGMIARNRYAWFGKYDSCPLPQERHRDRFRDV
jgi:predicted DCC family thiol-disulfide oxidoreductase YuxK